MYSDPWLFQPEPRRQDRASRRPTSVCAAALKRCMESMVCDQGPSKRSMGIHVCIYMDLEFSGRNPVLLGALEDDRQVCSFKKPSIPQLAWHVFFLETGSNRFCPDRFPRLGAVDHFAPFFQADLERSNADPRGSQRSTMYSGLRVDGTTPKMSFI